MRGLPGEGQLNIEGVDIKRPNKLSIYKLLPKGVVATEFFTLEQGGDLLEIHWLEKGQAMTPKKRAIVRVKLQAHNGKMELLEIWRLRGWAELKLVYSRLDYATDQVLVVNEIVTDLAGAQEWIRSW